VVDEGWNPVTYPRTIREDIPDYDVLQEEVVAATRDLDVRTVLELGTGSGETARRLLEAHPEARLYGRDSSEEMLSGARAVLPQERATLELGRLQDPLPEGRFDLVVSALTVHHLEGEAKADLFQRIERVLEPGGRFVLADLIVPENPEDVVTWNEPGYDFPSGVDDQLEWMRAAGLRERLWWGRRDLAVLIGDVGER
jgi:tRNA (cmo5U34)-methyltransferase